MKFFRRVQWVFVVMMLFGILLCAGAMAAQDEGDVTVLNTVIVSGSGTKTELLDTNASIHVLTLKDIQNSGQSSTAELISSIPGVVNQKSGSQTYFSVRGTRTGMSGGPKIYVDGRPINVGVYGYSKIDSIPIDNIEKIEVIKSPPTSKYGASAARGVILITTKNGASAKKKLQGSVSAEYGSWNTGKLTGGISGVSDQIDYSLSAYRDESDGYRDSDEETKSGDGQIGWQFDGGRLDLIAGINKSFNNYPIGLPQWQVDRDRTVAAANTKEDGSGYLMLPNESDEELANVLVKYDYDKNNWLVHSSVGFSRDQQDFFYKKYLNNSAKLDDNYRDHRVDKIYDVMASVGRRFDSGAVSNTLTFGLDYQYSDFTQDREYPWDTEDNNASQESTADIDAEKELFGANLNHDFSYDRFRLQSGLRYNSMTYDISNRVPDAVKIECDGDIDWNISPSYSVFDKANLFISWNRSHFYLPLGYYKSDMENASSYTQPQDLKPEVYDTLETGFKHQFSKGFNYSLIYYYTQVDDKVVSYYEGTTFKGYRNAGSSVHQGIEAEVDGRPLDWLGYRVSFTTIDAEWDKGTAKAYATPDATSLTVADLSGKKVNYVPEYEYSVGVDFFPLRNTSYGSLTLSIDLHGFGEQYEDYNNNLKMPAADYVDTKITWVFKGVECYLSCSNLFDKEWDRVVNAQGKAHDRFTTGSGFYPQDGRYVGFGVSYRF